jgi:cytochrome c5
MIARRLLPSFIFACMMLGTFGLAANSSAKRDASKETTVAVVHADDAAMRVEGEQRFRANCGRCHAAPQKFPPRMMKTVLRHMRVRATITDEDMRSILCYMTQ